MGWRPTWNGGGMELSGYIASWRNKTLTVSAAKQANAAAEKYQIKGLNALHTGIELNAHQQLTPWLKASVYAMTASWKWRNSGNAITYDTYSGETLKETSISCDGLHVGDAPQTQMGAQLDAKLHGGFYIHAGWQFNARMYADFEPSSRTPNDKADSYEFPSYHLLDATFGWEGALTKDVRINLFATGRNLLDTKYIERGTDGKTHDLDSFTGYWGAARTMSFGFRLSL
jgi:outer membrane receptor protein involved in Fe transport